MNPTLKVYPPASDNVQSGLEVVLAGSYDIPGLSLDKPPTILDVGCHVGSFSVWATQRWPGCKIVAFEPSPENYSYAKQNVGSNVELHNAAVVDDTSPPEMTLYDGIGNTGQRSLYQLGEQKPTGVLVKTVKASTLPPCEILKCDAEGSELPLLRSYPHLSGVKAVMLEWHRTEDYHELLKWLPTLGFELRTDLAKGDRMVFDRNLIFTRKPAATPSNYDPSIQGLRGEYELESLPDLPSPVAVLDIGANIGNFALYARQRWAGAVVHSYEPHPRTFELLCAAIGKEGVAVEAAVTHPARGRVRLYEGVNGSEECSIRDDVRWPHCSQRLDKWIDVETVDSAALPPCDVLKVDVEGEELPILTGYSHMKDVKILLVEAHPAGRDLRAQMMEIVRIAETAGLRGLDVRGTVLRFVRRTVAQGAAVQADTQLDGWRRVETIAGTFRIGRVVEERGDAVLLCPCFHITPERLVVPVPDPGAGLAATIIDIARPFVWGDGGEEWVRWSTFKKIAPEHVKTYLALVPQLA
jgi:FkbM family methyltransferase